MPGDMTALLTAEQLTTHLHQAFPGKPTEQNRPWHAVEAHRPPAELDGEVELAVCGAIVQVWGSQQWQRVGTGRTACPECRELTSVARPLSRAG